MSVTTLTTKITLLLLYATAGNHLHFDIRSWEDGKKLPPFFIQIPREELTSEESRSIGKAAHEYLPELNQVAALHGIGSDVFDDAWHRVQRALKREISQILGVDLSDWSRLTAIHQEPTVE